ncbi:phasin family protein [Paraburkholderia sp.]|jgi:phasin family protein|uniref:phasin family protein n=1 Tax=Paraburkholderia sp. TaxID=1926495 RepID=UPI002F42C911
MYSEIISSKTLDAAFDYTTALFGGLEELVELNVQTVKASLDEQNVLAQAALSARSIDEITELHTGQLPAAVKKTLFYWQHVEDIALRTQRGLLAATQQRLDSVLQTFAIGMNTASSVPALTARGENAGLVVVDEPPAVEVGSVAIVDSSGQIVSSGDQPSKLH